MGVTKIYKFPYPEPANKADVPSDMKALAEAVEAQIPDKNKIELDLADRALITETGNSIVTELDEETFILKIKLLNKKNEEISSQEIDLPLETMVVNANYDEETKELVLVLQNGTETRINVSDLVSGLVTDTKLAEDLKSKVDKEEGRGLSSNDFTNEDKEKLENLENYDDTKIKEDFDKKIKSITENIYRINVSKTIQQLTEYELPCNYTVGNDSLEIFFNNERLVCEKSEDEEANYREVGEKGQVSNKVIFGWNIEVGDILEIKVKGADENA